MEEKSSDKSIWGSVLICAALIVCAVILGGKLDGMSVSGGYGGSVGDVIVEAAPEYLYDNQAAEYLRMDWYTFERLLKRGDLDGTYVLFKAPAPKREETTAPPEPAPEPGPNGDVMLTEMVAEPDYYKPGDQYVFSRAKLDEYMQKLIEAGKAVQIPN